MSQIPIVDNESALIGFVQWKGRYDHGVFRFSTVDGLSDEEKRTAVDRYTDALARANRMTGVTFLGPDMRSVKGMSNFFGVAAALKRTLPGNSLQVDWSNIIWPEGTPSEQTAKAVREFDE